MKYIMNYDELYKRSSKDKKDKDSTWDRTLKDLKGKKGKLNFQN